MARIIGPEGSVHLDDLRISDFDRYLDEASSEDERRRVVDEDSARRFINEVLPRKPGLQYFFPQNALDSDYAKIVRGGFIQGLLEKNTADKARLEAQRFENKRPLFASRRDESVTHRVVRPVTLPNVRRWKKAPGRSDLHGVDTKIYTPRRTGKWVRQVRARGVRQWYVYRDVRTGKFLKNPEKR